MKIFNLLAFGQSRKVAFALWLFITSNIYLWWRLINADMWMNCVLLSSVLIGGGTAFDRFIAAKVSPKEKDGQSPS